MEISDDVHLIVDDIFEVSISLSGSIRHLGRIYGYRLVQGLINKIKASNSDAEKYKWLLEQEIAKREHKSTTLD